jgi:hypothetical protein
LLAPSGGEEGWPPPPHKHPYSHPNLSDWPVGGATAQGWGARPFIFLARCRRASRENWQSCYSLLTRATQPGLVSPDGGDHAQWYNSASLSSESRESLRPDDVGCYSGGYVICLGTGVFRPETCVSFLELYLRSTLWSRP